MVFYANCKINLGLKITAKRADGFHNIETIIYPINFSDIIEIVPSNKFSITFSGLKISGNVSENLCVKAFQLLKYLYDIPNVKIHLHKIIPMGAGLGGGSSDASFVLKSLNSTFKLNLDNNLLKNLSSKLGSDCPFFIDNIPTLASGVGTSLKEISLDLRGYFVALLLPKIHISTAEAYSAISKYSESYNFDFINVNKINLWKEDLINDFELGIFSKYPELEKLKYRLYDSGAIYASMSGSGSAIFGIFKSLPELNFYDVEYKIIAL
ncbi:MAG: 4-(cytidine 5'-diphospho)-2-C-methyl-D-erythritol kinase [Bacteroidetes bacterium CG2_30_33_31]|nr:MAG: 4-(cytidine 5'-diphospho)-2-C-methyl-D-erythritol kinase [Bacteroidetes bacterium CG2_30_33_31]